MYQNYPQPQFQPDAMGGYGFAPYVAPGYAPAQFGMAPPYAAPAQFGMAPYAAPAQFGQAVPTFPLAWSITGQEPAPAPTPAPTPATPPEKTTTQKMTDWGNTETVGVKHKWWLLGGAVVAGTWVAYYKGVFGARDFDFDF